MAHFDANSPLRTHRTAQYGSFTVLDLPPNCTHVELSCNTKERKK
jgi:hypothetical protein